MVPWDWHYKIYFDDAALRSAREMIDGLSSDERDICEETLAFYNSFYSFEIMIDCLEEKLADQSQVERIIGKAWENRDKLIRVPKTLEARCRERIGALGLDADKTQKLENLLELSFSGRQIRKEYWSYARKLFGSAFDEMVVQFDNDKYEDYLTGYKQEKISQDQETEFKAIYKKLARNSGLSKRFGENAIPDGSYDIEVKTGSCYGEWWDRDLLGGGRDKLVLYKNGAESNKEDLLYTAIHETYPGHGHFYNRIRNEKTVMDHGAMMLVEGWATYCEWNSLPSEYRDVTRRNAMTTLRCSYNCDADKNPERFFGPEADPHSSRAMAALVHRTQYVGYMESYYLGALWLELAIDRLGKFTPDGFLRMLKERNKGEFFRLWLPDERRPG